MQRQVLILKENSRILKSHERAYTDLRYRGTAFSAIVSSDDNII